MAKVQLLSGFALSGTVGGLVFCHRGGSVYARTRVKPRDPKTAAQRDRRHRFDLAVTAWRALPEVAKAEVRERAAREGRTGYHLFLAEFLRKAPAAAP